MGFYSKKYILTTCFISVFFWGSSQTKKTNIKFLDSIYTELSKSNKLDSLASFAHDLSIEFYVKKDFKNAIKFGQREVNLGLNTLDSSTYKNALRNLGLFYYRNGNFYQSISTYQKVIDSFSKGKNTLQAYCELGRNYKRLGDFHQALIYFEKGVSEPKYFSNKELLTNYSYLSDTYDSYDTDIKDFLKKKMILIKKIDSLNRLIKVDDYKIIDNEINYGNYYSNEEVLDVAKAKHHFEKGLEIATKIKDTFGIALINNNLSYLYNLIENDSSSIYAIRGIQVSAKDDPILIKLYTNLGKHHYNKAEISEAIKTTYKEFSLLLPEFTDLDFESIPSFESIALSKDKTHTVFTLKNLAFYFLEEYEATKQNKYLNLAYKVLILADQLLDTVKKESVATQTKLFWQQEASQIYMMAVKTCYLLNNTTTAFYFMEKKKAVLLLENLSDKQLRNSINLPDDILQKELKIKQSISKIENEIHYANNSEIDSLKRILNNQKINHTNFLKSLQNEYQAYYESKMPSQIINLDTFQKTLNDEDLVLEYVLDKTDGYLLSISKNKVEIFNFKNAEELIDKINSYNELVAKPFNTNADKTRYENLAFELYKTLLPKNVSEVNKLIIIPDYNLQRLSFEALKPSKTTPDYLIHNFEISYAYSLNFLNKNGKVNRTTEIDMVAFAPVNFNNRLPSLNTTNIEIDKLKKLIEGDYFLDSLATKEQFINGIDNSKIIHLATHANANDSISPWIAFRNENIFLNELYNTQNNAELVTLSACNTALGEIKEGEGVFSLARGFFHSGSNSVASTLWTANDKSTTFIIEEFYENLKKGQTKSKALQNAKLKYLETHSLSESSPYYWASFVLIGDAGTLELNTNFPIIYYAIFGAILILVLLFFFRRKKQK